MNPAVRTEMTPAQYLEFERALDVKHEYFRGDRRAMTGTIEERRTIAANLTRAIEQGLDHDRFRVTFPTSSVPDRLEIVVGLTGDESMPIVVLEIDYPLYPFMPRGWRIIAYERSPSLREFARVESDHMAILHFARSGDDPMRWIARWSSEPDEWLVLDAIGVRIALAAIYEGIDSRDESSIAFIREMAH